MTDDIQEKQPLQRILMKTKPVPFAIWMAGLALTATGPAVFFGWATYPEASARTVLLIQAYLCCLGGLMGLFTARMVRQSWLATFGECIEGRVASLEQKPKSQIGLQIGFGVALVASTAAFAQLLIGVFG